MTASGILTSARKRISAEAGLTGYHGGRSVSEDGYFRSHVLQLEEEVRRPRRRVAAAHRMERPEISAVNACWSMDFVADQLFNGQKIRALTVVDNFSRESLAITVDYALKAADVVATMGHLKALRGTPKQIVHWFLSLDDAREKIEGWRQDWNDFRPHSSLVDLTPGEFRLAHLDAGNL